MLMIENQVKRLCFSMDKGENISQKCCKMRNGPNKEPFLFFEEPVLYHLCYGEGASANKHQVIVVCGFLCCGQRFTY